MSTVTTIDLPNETTITQIFEEFDHPFELEKPITLKPGFYKISLYTDGTVTIWKVSNEAKVKVAEGKVKNFPP